jgi:pantoate--beta-alanine ligase
VHCIRVILSLIDAAQRNGSLTLSSIFVNPTQFNDPSDFQKYPRPLEKDIYLLEKKGTDKLIMQSHQKIKKELYPGGTAQLEHYDLGILERSWEGLYRPGHFQGVCQVMRRLIERIGPDDLYMGQKDYQQSLVVEELLRIMGSQAILHRCPTVRETDGLAMSSRNIRLDKAARTSAAGMYEALLYVRDHLRKGPLAGLLKEAVLILTRHQFVPDYLGIAALDSLEPMDNWDGLQPLIALAAGFQEGVRLIDNLELNQPT